MPQYKNSANSIKKMLGRVTKHDEIVKNIDKTNDNLEAIDALLDKLKQKPAYRIGIAQQHQKALLVLVDQFKELIEQSSADTLAFKHSLSSNLLLDLQYMEIEKEEIKYPWNDKETKVDIDKKDQLHEQ